MDEFLREIDRKWRATGNEPITLRVFGKNAVLFQCKDYFDSTKDVDIFEIYEIDGKVWDQLRRLAGKDTKLALKHRLYVDLVGTAVPFLPPSRIYHPLDLKLRNFHILTLGLTDVVVSKLYTFRTGDRDDIRALIDKGLVQHGKLLERFRLAMDQWSHDARCNKLPAIIENLNTVERDYFRVAETDVPLPSWVENV